MAQLRYGDSLDCAVETYRTALRRFMRAAEKTTAQLSVKYLPNLQDEINRILLASANHHKMVHYDCMAQTARMLLTMPQPWSGQPGQERSQIAELHQSACTHAEQFLSRMEENMPISLCRYMAFETANLG